MLKIRLTRVGKTNSARYRVVVAEQKKAVKGKFIEILGHYNPTSNPSEIVINKERALFWMERGAQASDTVNNLMCDLGILDKKAKIEKKFAKKFTKKQIKEGADKEPEKSETPAAETETTEEVASEEVAETPAEETEVAEETPVTEEAEKPAEEK